MITAQMGSYLWSLLAFIVGALAGFQGIHNRFPLESYQAAFRLPGIAYLFTRGLVPSIAFFAMLGRVPLAAPALAASLGVSVELVLRARFFLGERRKTDGSFEEILAGPFNLLKWYQEWFLDRLGDHVVAIRIDSARRLIPPDLPLTQICQRVIDRLDLITNPTLRKRLSALIEKHKKEFTDDGVSPADATENDRRRFRLVLALRNVLGEAVLKHLLAR